MRYCETGMRFYYAKLIITGYVSKLVFLFTRRIPRETALLYVLVGKVWKSSLAKINEKGKIERALERLAPFTKGFPIGEISDIDKRKSLSIPGKIRFCSRD